MDSPGFQILPFSNQISYDDDVLRVMGLAGYRETTLRAGGTAFVAVLEGALAVRTPDQGEIILRRGMYGSVPAPGELVALVGCAALVVVVKGWHGLFTVGGPIEQRGRLKYIDGCTDTGILAPPKQGDPCLNCLFFPAHTTQTAHTHPSHRVGLVIDGQGWCHTEGRTVPMGPGSIFLIPAGCVHAFTTEGEAMRIIVCHPDSDVGPTDEVHQMLAATLIEREPVPDPGPPEQPTPDAGRGVRYSIP